jgi:multidrug resistance efflux pump
MTWSNRIRLFIGVLAVLVIVGACTLAFNQRQLRTESTNAAIAAEEFSVGTIYAGTIIEQLVEQGDEVVTGQMLFRVRSPLLARDLASEYVTAADLGVAVEPDGTFPVVATVDGTVSEVLAPLGDFTQAGAVLATVDRAKTLTVEAEFTLTPRDYGRIAEGTSVEILLPDDQTIRGKVTDIDVDTLEGEATTSVTIGSAALEAQAIGGLYRPGTPVLATLHLRDDGPLAGVTDVLRDFLRKIGL